MTTTKNELFSGLEHEHFYLVGRLTFDGGNKHLLVGGGADGGVYWGEFFLVGSWVNFWLAEDFLANFK